MRGALLGSALLGNTLLRHSTWKWCQRVRSSFYTNWGNLMPFSKASDGHLPQGIIWTLFTSLENLDFADDLALVLHTHQRMQEKTTQLWTYAQQVGLNISQKKTEVLLNVSNPTTEQVNGEDLPTIVEFPYLGSTVRHDGGAGSDIKNRLNKTRNTFGMHNNVWRSSQYSTKMKLRIYQNFVLSTFLCGSEYWRMLEKLSVLHTQMFWPDTISNQQLLACCSQDNMGTIIMKRWWRWIGRVMRRDQDNNTRAALHWTPEGEAHKRESKNTWCQTVEAELKTLKHTWCSIHKLALNHQTWISFVADLHATRHKGHEWVWSYLFLYLSINEHFTRATGGKMQNNLVLCLFSTVCVNILSRSGAQHISVGVLETDVEDFKRKKISGKKRQRNMEKRGFDDMMIMSIWRSDI